MKKPKDVDSYIKSCPKEHQKKLKQIRKAIISSAPKAMEKISYGMPYYSYKGRLAYFRLSKEHIGLYITPPIISEFKSSLKEYETAKATIRFPLKEKLPISLIKKIIRARVKRNEKSL